MSLRSKLKRACFLALLTASEHDPPAWAEPGLSYSGRLVTSDGKPVQGAADLVVRFFDQESGGTPLIGERMFGAVPLDDGMFEVELNLNQSDLNTVLGNGSTSVYIEISHGPTTYPRQKFAAVPYALRVPIDRSSIIQDDQGRLSIGTIPASKILDLTSATAGVIGGVSFDQTNPIPGKVIKWNGSKYYLDIDATSGAGGAMMASTITTTEQAALTISPYGVGSGETGEIRFGELAASGSNYIAFKAPDTLASNLVWTLPTRDGTSGELLTSNGSGELAWSVVSNANILDTGISDSKLQTISTPGKVSGSAITGGTLGGSTAFNGTGGIDTLGPIASAGNITLKGRGSAASELHFADQDSSHYLSFKAPATLTDNRAWILPLADGAPGTALTTDGNGNLSWVRPDVAASASIVTSKLSGPVTAIADHGLGTLSLQNAVGSAQITDFTIVDADIASTASIAGTKISFADDGISGNKIQGGVISDFASVGIDDNAGSLVMTIDSSGNVGIGTTSPSALLHADASTTSGGANTATFQAQNIGAHASHIHWGTTGDVYWRSASPYGKVILQDFGGNVGIGTATPANTLSVAGSANFTGYVGIGTTNPQKQLEVNGDIKAVKILSSHLNSTDGNLLIDTASNLADIAFGANYLVVKSGGNVGIGTTTPAAKLHVNGSLAGNLVNDTTLAMNMSLGNFRTNNVTAGTLSFDNMVDGTTYTVILTNTNGGNYVLSGSSVNSWRCSPDCNSATITAMANRHTVLSITKTNTTAYVFWTDL